MIINLGLQFHSRAPPHVLGESDSTLICFQETVSLSGFSTHLLWCQKTASLFRISTHLYWSSESSFTLWVLNSFALVSRKQFHSSGSQLTRIRVQKTVSLFGFSTSLLWSSEKSYNSSGSQLICFGLQKTSFIL
jgi:hypothetical protein